MNILILEASTSSAKAMVYSTADGPVQTKSIPYDSLVSDVMTQDADLVLDAVLKMAKELTAQYAVDLISISSIWHSLLVVDGKFRPKTRAFSWAYIEATEEARMVREDAAKAFAHYRNTGGMVHAAYPLFKLMYLRNNGLTLFPDDRILDLGSYLFSKLTSDVVQSISMASGSGFLNISTLDWDEGSLELSRTCPQNFPKLVDHRYTGILSERYAKELHLPTGIPVIAAHPDGALNQVGSGALKNGVMTLSVGTSGALRMAYDKPYLSGGPSTWCYYAPGKWLVGAATSGCTNCLDWFASKMMENKFTLAQLDRMVGNDDAEPPIFLPFLFGERSPGWNEGRWGGFVDVKGNHTTGDLYRSILEGVLFNLYQCYEELTKEVSSPKIIKVSGGILRSPVWLQMLADIFQMEMQVSKSEQDSMLGAAALGMLALGEIGDLEDFALPQEDSIRPLSANRDVYQKRFSHYLEFYHQKNQKIININLEGALLR